MKKALFALICTVALFFSVALETQAQVGQPGGQNGNPETEVGVQAPISRWWHETFPIPYEGRTKYVQIVRLGQCLDGYLGARNLGGGHFKYEGYLYPCNGSKPIPTKAPIEGESE